MCLSGGGRQMPPALVLTMFSTNLKTKSMHLAYSALKRGNNPDERTEDKPAGDRLLRYMTYLETCEKYRHQIAAIRKYFPGWAPEFR